MASTTISLDFSEYKEFVAKLRRAASGDWQKELALIMEGVGFEFLRIVEDEIIRRKVIDSRMLLNSFHKDGDGSVWEVSDDGMTLEVGTNVSYASYANDGHWLNPKGVETRFVPGVWHGDHFEYVKGAKTGMMLKQRWIEGKHYWESAIRIIERILPGTFEKLIQQWFASNFE